MPYENLSSSLLSLGFAPRTKLNTDRIWYTYWREDVNAVKSYIFVYNDAWDRELGSGSSDGSVTFQTTGVPYMYDAWTGDQHAILGYTQAGGTTTIPLTLAGNQSTIIAFHHNEVASCPRHPQNSPAELYGMHSHDDDTIWVKSGRQTHPIHLPNGTVYMPPSASAPLNLTDWNLIIESWSAPKDIYADQTQSTKANMSYTLTSLQPWTSISDSLRNTSGRGFYTTTFPWPPAGGREDGAMLDLGAVVNTARLWINGHLLPPLDPTHAVSDISEFLQHGQNKVLVVVATTLGNAVRPHWEQLRSSGTLALGPLPPVQEYGLVSDVLVKPYKNVKITM